MTETVGAAAVAAFEPVLGPLGFRVVEQTDAGATFEGAAVRLTAKFEPRDGDVAVHVEPRDGSQRVQLALYLQAIGSAAAGRLRGNLVETETEAIAELPIYAAGLADAKDLLLGEPSEVERAQALRWWDVPPTSAVSRDIRAR